MKVDGIGIREKLTRGVVCCHLGRCLALVDLNEGDEFGSVCDA
jgi:hypothetical protein